MQAADSNPCAVGLRLVFQAVDLAQHRALLQLNSGLGQVGLRLIDFPGSLLGLALVLRSFLFYLVRQVFVLRLGITRRVEL